MNYTEEQVIDIIKSITKESPSAILEKWGTKDSNIHLDLSKYQYPMFVFTFPILIEEKEIGTFTLVHLAYTGRDNMRKDLMRKYLGHTTYDVTYQSYINDDTYLEGYLTINQEFELPEIVKGFYAQESFFQDKNGQQIRYRLSYGYPVKENDSYIWTNYTNDIGDYNSYRFDGDICVQIEKKEIEGYSLGEKINENINIRIK